MDLSELKKRMRKFTLKSLETYLGSEIVDTLLEWTPEHKTLFTKSKLSEMILTIHGTKILNKVEFRKDLIETFQPLEVESFRPFLKGVSEDSTNPYDLVNIISERPWKDDSTNRHLLELLKIDDDLFAKSDDKKDVKKAVGAYDRFFELLDYQFVIKQRILHNLTSGNELARMIVHMPTGTGKTKTAVHTICHHYNFNLKKQGLIIWIAHTTELLEQAYETFDSVWKHLGNGEINLYRLYGSHSPSPDTFDYNGIVFCGIQKLMNLSDSNPKLMEGLIEKCSLIVFDEAHKAPAEETKKVIEKFMFKMPHMCDRALIGLTATPGRATEETSENRQLVVMFDNKSITIDIETLNNINLSKLDAMNTRIEGGLIPYFQKNKILAKIRKEQLTYPENLTPSELEKIRETATENGFEKEFTPKALETIGKNKSRNLAIMQRLMKLHEDEIPTIVFACSVKHGQLLSSMLSIENIPNALVIGDMPSKERDDAIKAFKDKSSPIKILINFDVLTTGFDSTNIRCVFITRPTQSVVRYSQMIGRGLRGPKMGGNEECLLIDVKDNLEKYDEKLAFNHFDGYWRA